MARGMCIFGAVEESLPHSYTGMKERIEPMNNESPKYVE